MKNLFKKLIDENIKKVSEIDYFNYKNIRMDRRELMNWYLINLLIIVIIGLVSLLFKSRDTRKKFFLYASFLQLFLFLGLRAIDVGVDLPNYFYFYDKCNQLGWSQVFSFRYEPFYIIYTKLIANFINDKQIFLVVTAFLSLIGPLYIIKKYSKNYFLSTFLFITFQFYTYDFYILRQVIAMSILLLSLKYVEKRNFPKFAIMVGVATCFHTSAFLFIIVYWFSKIKIDNKKILMITGMMIAILLFGDKIINMALNIVYQYYVGSVGEEGGYFYLIVLLIAFLSTTLVKNAFHLQQKNNFMWYNVLIISIFIQLFAIQKPIISRITIYYSIALIIVIPNAIQCIKDKNLKMLIDMIICLGFFIFYLTRLENKISYMDYHFFWQ